MAYLISNHQSALKEVILPYIQDNFPKVTVTLNQFKRNAGVTHMNNAFHAPLRTARHGGVTSLANDGNNINASNGATVGRGSVAVKTHTGAFNISKLAIDASKGNVDAVKSSLTFQADSLITDFSRGLNMQLYNGPTGIIGQVAGSTSGTTITITDINSATIDDGRAVDYYGSVNRDILPEKYFTAGQIIGIGTNAAAVGTVSSVSGSTVNLTGATASAANDAIFLLDGSGGGAGSNFMNGVRDALSSTTGTSLYAGVARSTTGWTPQFGSTAEALTLQRMESAYLSAREYSQEGDRYAIFVNKSLYAKYGQLLTSMRRTVNSTELVGGWTGLEFSAGAGKVGVFLDYDVPDGEVVILDLDTWTLCQVSDMDWFADATENSMLRLQNTITYQATLVWFANVMCLGPAANARETQKTD